MTRRKVLVYAAVLLVALIGLELSLGSRDTPIEPGKTAAGEIPLKPIETNIEFPPVDRYSEFVERPLFSSTRRPFEASDKVPTGPNAALTAFNFDLELSGITLSGTHKLALIKTKRDKAQHRIGQGEEFRGWTLDQVLADKVVMLNGTETQELALIRKGDPLAAKRKKLEQKRKQLLSARAHAKDKKGVKSSPPEAKAEPDPEPDADPEADPEQDTPPPESQSEEEQ